MTEPALTVTDVRVAYGATLALDGVSLEVGAGEVLALLGPSGSGKTTLLQAAAGFVDLEAGEIAVGGTPVASRTFSLAPEKRRVGVVFQSYALWPHMRVLDTVAYPFERRGIARSEARERATHLLDRVGLADYTARRPGQLSGGQQQRVGLARALAAEPVLFLFDEPTANLDTTLRAALQAEIREQLGRTGAGALYVTHDPAEAFLVADRVAVLRAGRLVQVAPPVEVYHAPLDRWVAALTGGGSILPASVPTPGALCLSGQDVPCRLYGAVDDEAREVCLRPGWVRLAAPGTLPLRGSVRTAQFQGYHTDYTLETPAGEVLVREPGTPRFPAGARISWAPTDAAILAVGG